MPHIIMFLYHNYLPWFFMRMVLNFILCSDSFLSCREMQIGVLTFTSKRLQMVLCALSLSPALGCTSVSPIVHRSRVAISLSAFWYVATYIVHLESTTYDFFYFSCLCMITRYTNSSTLHVIHTIHAVKLKSVCSHCNRLVKLIVMQSVKHSGKVETIIK